MRSIINAVALGAVLSGCGQTTDAAVDSTFSNPNAAICSSPKIVAAANNIETRLMGVSGHIKEIMLMPGIPSMLFVDPVTGEKSIFFTVPKDSTGLDTTVECDSFNPPDGGPFVPNNGCFITYNTITNETDDVIQVIPSVPQGTSDHEELVLVNTSGTDKTLPASSQFLRITNGSSCQSDDIHPETSSSPPCVELCLKVEKDVLQTIKNLYDLSLSVTGN